MPNGAQYREAASRFRSLGEQYLRQAALATGWPVGSHLGDGPVADAVVGALDRSAAHLTSASDDLGRIVTECLRRAAICDRFRADVDRWARGDLIGIAPPVPPYPWVSL